MRASYTWEGKVLPWLLVMWLPTLFSGSVKGVSICEIWDVTYPSYGGGWGSHGKVTHSSNDSKFGFGSDVQPCMTRFTLQPNCAVFLKLDTHNFRGCYESFQREITNSLTKSCDSRCTYLFVYDPNYLNATMKYFFSGDAFNYTGVSKRTNVGLCMSQYDQSIDRNNFKLSYKVVEKLTPISGSSQDSSSPEPILSVNFPHGYSIDGDTYSYKIQSRNQDDFIKVTFDDWDLSDLSRIEFDGASVNNVDGSDNRPIVTSTKNWLQLRFSTGTQYGISQSTRHMGFKFSYSFITSRSHDDPSTDCGAYKLDQTGGVIKFTGSTSAQRPSKYDCIWVVKKQPHFSKLYLKLIQSTIYRSSAWSNPNRYQVYYGLSSEANFFRSFPPESDDLAKTGFKTEDGFYIRLTGTFYEDDLFKMAFASYDSLPDGTSRCTHGLFTCSNKRCIDELLECDGTDHCGDNSDEISCPASSGWSPEGHTPFSLSISIIIPIVVAMFLVIVICLFVVFLRRCQQAQRQRNSRNPQVPSVSGRMGRGRRTRRSQIRVTIQQEFEDAPPTYEEAIGTPPNLGYFNMAFMWSQPDMSNGLMSPPPYTEIAGSSPEENGDLSSADTGNRQSTDSLQSNRERREVQSLTEPERQQSSYPCPSQQPGDVHIVLRRSSNTPSSGTNSLEHSHHSIGRQPLHAPVDALYEEMVSARNKSKQNQPSPQISVSENMGKPSTDLSQDILPQAGANDQPSGGDNPLVNSSSHTVSPASSVTNPQSKERAGKSHKRRHRQRNAAQDSSGDPSSSRTSHQPNFSPLIDRDSLHSLPQFPVSRSSNGRPRAMDRAIRPSLSYADIPSSSELSCPPDPRRASSAGRLSFQEEQGSLLRAPTINNLSTTAPRMEETVSEQIQPPAQTLREGTQLDEEEAYRQRLSHSAQQLHLMLRRETSEDEDMFV